MADPGPPSPPPAPGFGLSVVLLLAMAVGILTQFLLGILAPFMMTDLGISRAQLGTLTTILYITGGVFSPVAGPLVDALGGRRVLFALFGAGGAAWVGMALVPSYAWLLVATVPAGFALAASNPVTNQLVSAYVPPARQGQVIGFKQSGGSIATVLAGILFPRAALAVGWRPVLAATVSLALLGAVGAARLVPRGHVRSRLPSGVLRPGGLGREVSWLAGYGVFMGAGMAVVFTYLPLYAYEELGLSAAHAGQTASVMALVSIVALNAWGRLTDRLGGPILSLGLVALMSVIFTGVIAVAGTGVPWLIWLGAGGIGASAVGWFTLGMLIVVRRFDPSVAGRASGIVLLAFFAGLVSSPVAFGYSVDVTGSYAAGWMVTAFVFAAAFVTAAGWRRRERRPDHRERPAVP